jgi:hypothetical protein
MPQHTMYNVGVVIVDSEVVGLAPAQEVSHKVSQRHCMYLRRFHEECFAPSRSQAGLPDFSWSNVPKREKICQNGHKIYEMVIKYTKRPKMHRPNGHKIYQNFYIFKMYLHMY